VFSVAASGAYAQCAGPPGIPFNCKVGTAPQPADLLYGGSQAQLAAGNGGGSVSFAIGLLFANAPPITSPSGTFGTLNVTGTFSGPAFATFLSSPPPIGNTAPNSILGTTVGATVSLGLPVWATSGRPTSPSTGVTGWNSTLQALDTWSGTAWSNPSSGGKVMYATNIITDGNVQTGAGTSNDAALFADLTACSAVGATLVLPPGPFKIDGSLATSGNLSNCHIVGTGANGGANATANVGTTVMLTSTTQIPFIAGSNWSWSGTNFYWPGQINGTTVFPPLLKNTTFSISWSFFNNTVINAYTLYDETSGAGAGDWNIHDNYIYAIHTILHSYGQGDTIQFSHNDLTPGPWFNIAPSTSHAAVTAAGQVNKWFDVDGTGAFAWNIIAMNNSAFEWRWEFLFEPQGEVGISSVSGTVDSVGTLIDTETNPGGTWAIGNYFSMVGDCNTLGISSGAHASPCFNLGSSDYLVVSDSQLSTNGSFVEAAGADVFLSGSQVNGVGSQNDGTEYYAIHETANPGGTTISVKDSTIQGNGASNKAHTHGITTGATATRVIIQNNQFGFFNDDINIQSAPTTIITGNWSINTGATGGLVSVNISGSNGVIWNSNTWDAPPVIALSSCGTTPVAHGTTFAGAFTTGSGAPTACTMTLPFFPMGFGAGACQFSILNSGTTFTSNVAGSPPAWTLTFGSGLSGGIVSYNCPGVQ